MSPCVGRDGGRRSHRAGRAARGGADPIAESTTSKERASGIGCGSRRGASTSKIETHFSVAARSPPAVEQGEARRAHGPRDIVRGRCPGHLRGAADRSPAKRHGHDLFRSRSDRARSARRAQHHRSRCPRPPRDRGRHPALRGSGQWGGAHVLVLNRNTLELQDNSSVLLQSSAIAGMQSNFEALTDGSQNSTACDQQKPPPVIPPIQATYDAG